MIKKGIILAGGKGTRLSPLTKILNKQLLPLYDKPLIFYPLSVLMLAGIKDILIITNRGDTNLFKKILNNGKNLGIKISYKEQKKTKRTSGSIYHWGKIYKKSKCSFNFG
jgi:glucose-1-phosphate thymidylyltransferase